MKHKKTLTTIGIFAALLTLATGCTFESNYTSTLPGQPIAAGMGRLVINITDNPSAPDIDEVQLTITGMQVHMAGSDEAEEEEEQEQNNGETQNQENNQNQNENGGWIDLDLFDESVDPPEKVEELKFNLLDYQNGLQTMMAIQDLDPGWYTQIRMDVALVELHIKDTDADKYEEAKLPSGTLKFVHPFQIVMGEETELLFDIDALRSVHVTGNDKYMFRPVIQLTTIWQPQVDLEITTLSLPNGVVGSSYAPPALTATGGKEPYTWSLEEIAPVEEGNSLSIDAGTGVITGTFEVAGDYSLTVKVEDDSNNPKTATKTFEIEIAEDGALQIITTSLPDAAEGVEYPVVSLTAVGGLGPYSWNSADLPAGLSLSSEGEISGTPTVNGTLSFTVEVADSATPDANTDTQVILIRIIAAEES